MNEKTDSEARAESDESMSEATTVGSTADCPPIPTTSYEYLDHTADVQLHAWGKDFSQALEQVGTAMFGYMTELETVGVEYSFDITASASDEESLLFHFLDEWLFAFSAEPFFIPRVIKVLELDTTEWRVRARGWGESFDLAKHPQGTEVKAITYSNMQIHHKEGQTDIYVIIDI